MLNQILLGDCFDLFSQISDKSINLVLTDPPYNITSNSWDKEIDLPRLWKELDRICVDTAAIIFTASQPFTSLLVCSNLKMFKDEFIWVKNRGSNFANLSRSPFKEHESVLMFSKGKWTYNPQMQPRTGSGADRVKYKLNYRSKSENYRDFEGRENVERTELRYPSSWQKFNTQTGVKHPTVKPVDLFRYFIRTYSNENDVILDPFIGSGTTAVACIKENRKYIGIEKEEKYYKLCLERVADK